MHRLVTVASSAWESPYEDETRFGAAAGEVGILGEEAVAGVDRLRAGAQRSFDDAAAVQVALAGGSRPDVHRLISGTHVRGPGVRIGVNRHAADPHVAKRADHP